MVPPDLEFRRRGPGTEACSMEVKLAYHVAFLVKEMDAAIPHFEIQSSQQ